MKKIVVTIASLICLQYYSSAQNEIDALRYTQTTFGGTARSNSMCGAFGALGADFSVLSTNPAGIALFRKNEIMFTPSVFYQNTSSTYNSETNSDSKFNFNFENAGIVWTYHANGGTEKSEWKSFNFGFGYNRLNDFNNNINIHGSNSNSSLTDIYLHYANGVNSNNLNSFNEGLAYDTYLIDNPGGGVQYISNIPSGGMIQSKSIQTSGNMGEFAFSFGGNYADKLYLGATIGIQNIDYLETSVYSETAEKDSAGTVHSFQLNQYLHTTGTGINLKLGMIYRINDWVRIGAAFHSPASFAMYDRYSSNMTTTFADSIHQSYSPNGNYSYSLVTTPRIIGSVGFILAKRGLIDIDYEYVNYSFSSLSSTDAGAFSEPNNRIIQNYRATGNLRIGAECKIIESISLRGGFAYYGNPYKNGVNVDASRTSYSGGISFKEKGFYIDIAYVLTQYKENYYLYDPAYAVINPVNNSFSSTRIMTTFGFRF